MPCDTFVFVGNGYTVFGKNSDRPSDEVQLVEICQPEERKDEILRKCTYISIPGQDRSQNGGKVLISRPSWMFGCEMGVNEHGVAIGNEAVWTNMPLNDQAALLGMDLVRIGLERARTAEEALETITELLTKYGQGGSCVEGGDWSYHNSFMIADATEAWVLETAGTVWVAEHVQRGVRSVSNNLSIHKHDRSSGNLMNEAKRLGFTGIERTLDFAQVFAEGDCTPSERELCGRRLLTEAMAGTEMDTPQPQAMMSILRSHEGAICAHRGDFATTGAQVSVLYAQERTGPKNRSGSKHSRQDMHWFTGTCHPCCAVFKPVAFVDGDIGDIRDKGIWKKHLNAFGGDKAKDTSETMLNRKERMVAFEQQLHAHVQVKPQTADMNYYNTAMEQEMGLYV